MEFIMKNISMYSLLFALLALSPLQMNAMETSKSLLFKYANPVVLLNNITGQFAPTSFGSNLGAFTLGMIGGASLGFSIKNFVDWQWSFLKAAKNQDDDQKDAILAEGRTARNYAGLSFLAVLGTGLAYRMIK
jgi:hypothetical protein